MASSTLSGLPAWAGELLAAARVARFGLLDGDGRPRVLPITFAVVDGRIWSAIDHKSKRVPTEDLARLRWLRRDPRAAVTVDHYADRWDELAWVQILGTVRIVASNDATAALANLAAKYAPYRRAAPPGPLLALDPQRCLWWRASQPHD